MEALLAAFGGKFQLLDGSLLRLQPRFSAVMAVLRPDTMCTEKPANSIRVTMTNKTGPITAMGVAAGDFRFG